MGKSKAIQESVVNHVGQTLVPGDVVIAIGSGYGHSTSERKGIFNGYFPDHEGKPKAYSVKYKEYYSWLNKEQECYMYLPRKRVYKLADV